LASASSLPLPAPFRYEYAREVVIDFELMLNTAPVTFEILKIVELVWNTAPVHLQSKCWPWLSFLSTYLRLVISCILKSPLSSQKTSISPINGKLFPYVKKNCSAVVAA
jgi:hypothetical protein